MGSTISTGIKPVENIFNKKYKKHVDKNSIVSYYMQADSRKRVTQSEASLAGVL